MKKLLLILLILPFAGFTQQVNFEKYVIDSQSYQALVKRFILADTTLSKEDLKTLYFGFAFQKEYDPEKFIPVENRIRDLNSLNLHEKAINLADSLLNLYPVSLVALFEKSFACGRLKLYEEEGVTNKKYMALLRTVINTGDGLSPETAFQIISPNDEFDIIRFFDLTALSYIEITYNGKIFDVLDLKRNKLKAKQIYFDITLPAKLKEQKKVELLREK